MLKTLLAVLVCSTALFAQHDQMHHHAPGPTHTQKQAPQSPGAIAAVKQRMIGNLAAWSSMDINKAAEFYDKDPGDIFFDVEPLQYHGWSEYQQGGQKLFDTFKSLKLTLNDDAKIHMGGYTSAWASATVNFDATDKGGKTNHMVLRWTSVWEKENGQWLCVHEHMSAPLRQ
jgi:ketosteroid isomerase-like protein